MQSTVITAEIRNTTSSTCFAALSASFGFSFPIYWEQMIQPPAASAEKAWITSTLIESTRETADMAAAPTLLTMMVSAVPIREFKSCSTIRGTSSAHRARLLNNLLCDRELTVVQFCIKTTFCEQFFMISLLDNMTVFHDQYHICILDRR